MVDGTNMNLVGKSYDIKYGKDNSMLKKIISTPVNIPAFDVYDYPGSANKKILFHASGNIDIDIDNALKNKNETSTIIWRLFDAYQSKFSDISGLINIYNKFNNKLPKPCSLYESFCADVVSVLGKRIQNKPELENSQELRSIVRYSYDYVNTRDWEQAQRIEMDFGGIGTGLGKAVIDRITRP